MHTIKPLRDQLESSWPRFAFAIPARAFFVMPSVRGDAVFLDQLHTKRLNSRFDTRPASITGFGGLV